MELVQVVPVELVQVEQEEQVGQLGRRRERSNSRCSSTLRVGHLRDLTAVSILA